MVLLSAIPVHQRFSVARLARTTQPSSLRLFVGRILSFLAVLACAFFDSKHAARVTVGTAHAKKNLSLARTCNELFLRLTCNFHVSAHHVHGHARNTVNECADAAASLGMRGFVSVNNFRVFWPERGLFGQRLVEFHHCLAQHSFHTRERHLCLNAVATSTKNSEADGWW